MQKWSYILFSFNVKAKLEECMSISVLEVPPVFFFTLLFL